MPKKLEGKTAIITGGTEGEIEIQTSHTRFSLRKCLSSQIEHRSLFDDDNQVLFHSVRSARIGSRAAALRAGRRVAMRPATVSTSVVTSKISGA